MAEKQNLQLSIIVPVYGVEKYIRPCIDSIFCQGLDEKCYEVIIVNDGTKDRSMEIIQDIIDIHDNITIVNQENQGLSVARNVGISLAQGEYIIMPDSDDLLIDNSLAKLLDVALSSKADLVVADFLEMDDEEIENLKAIPQKRFEMIEKTGEKLFLEDLNPYQCYVWRTLFRREFLTNNNLKFVPGIYFQDVPFTHECYIKAKKCIRTSWLLNIYRRGHESATFSFNRKKAKDFCIVIAEIWKLTRIEGLTLKAQKTLRKNIYTSFSLMICSIVREKWKLSDKVHVIYFLRQLAPDLHFNNGSKQIFVSFMFRYLPYSYICLRYLYAIVFEDRFFPFYYHWLRRPFK